MKYIDTTLVVGPYYTLCFSEEAYYKEVKKLNVEDPLPFTIGTSRATTHIITKDEKSSTCIVCMLYDKKDDDVLIVGLLAHEASHILDAALKGMREDCPGEEVRAYALQSITQNLYSMYKKYAKKRNKNEKEKSKY